MVGGGNLYFEKRGGKLIQTIIIVDAFLSHKQEPSRLLSLKYIGNQCLINFAYVVSISHYLPSSLLRNAQDLREILNSKLIISGES